MGHAQNLVVVLRHVAASLEGLAAEQVPARQATAGTLCVSTQACQKPVPIARGGVREGEAMRGILEPFNTISSNCQIAHAIVCLSIPSGRAGLPTTFSVSERTAAAVGCLM